MLFVPGDKDCVPRPELRLVALAHVLSREQAMAGNDIDLVFVRMSNSFRRLSIRRNLDIPHLEIGCADLRGDKPVNPFSRWGDTDNVAIADIRLVHGIRLVE